MFRPRRLGPPQFHSFGDFIFTDNLIVS